MARGVITSNPKKKHFGAPLSTRSQCGRTPPKLKSSGMYTLGEPGRVAVCVAEGGGGRERERERERERGERERERERGERELAGWSD